ncbi:hypothetical protein llap_8596 [Limosa lapponica baueri]|uniref:Uncharacterized protein n=1 Tax=Limosa lapponica baueri TaxID=1758121 RepID=A0A2I0U4W1_LIMLA|nr:hypothetical protein llap_8596 [Limosa lapponica baueri]
MVLNFFTTRTLCWLMVSLLSWDSQALLCRASFQPVSLQPMLVHGVIPPQRQGFAVPFVELHEVPLCTFLHPVEITLNGNTTIHCINNSFQFCIITKLKAHSILSSISLMKMLNSTDSSINTWDALSDLLTTGLCAADDNPLGPAA